MPQPPLPVSDVNVLEELKKLNLKLDLISIKLDWLCAVQVTSNSMSYELADV